MDFCRQENTFRQYLQAGLHEAGINAANLIEAAGIAAIISNGNREGAVGEWHRNGELIVVPEIPFGQSLAERTAHAHAHGMAAQVGTKIQGHIGPKCWIRECTSTDKNACAHDPLNGAKNLNTLADYLEAMDHDIGQVKAVAEFCVTEQRMWDGEMRIFVNRVSLEQLVNPYVKQFSPEFCAEQIAFVGMLKIQYRLRKKKKAL